MNLTNSEKESICNIWQNVLGLSHIPIRFTLLQKERFNEKYGFNGSCGYHRNSYEIILTKESNEYIIIHELGHIYLHKHTNSLYCNGIKPKNNNKEIYHFKNAIIDSFTNYQLYQFLFFSPIYLKEINCFISFHNSFVQILSFYIKSYLCYNFILLEEDKKKLPDLPISLDRTKNILQIKGKELYKKSIKANILKLDYHLNTFGKIKDTTNYKEIIDFVREGLERIGLWPKVLIEEELRKKDISKTSKKLLSKV